MGLGDMQLTNLISSVFSYIKNNFSGILASYK